MSIKLLVNDKKIWDSFNELIDQKLKFVHSQLEQTMKSEDLYRLQSMHVPVYMDAISARYGWNVEDALIKGMNI